MKCLLCYSLWPSIRTPKDKQCQGCVAQVPKSAEALDIMELTLVFDLTWGNLEILVLSHCSTGEEGMRPCIVKPVNFDKGK